jgi:hypothetical protein
MKRLGERRRHDRRQGSDPKECAHRKKVQRANRGAISVETEFALTGTWRFTPAALSESPCFPVGGITLRLDVTTAGESNSSHFCARIVPLNWSQT